MSNQKLHLVMGGRVSDPQTLEFTDLASLDLVGVYATYAEAEEAEMRYVVVHLHRLLEPEQLKR